MLFIRDDAICGVIEEVAHVSKTLVSGSASDLHFSQIFFFKSNTILFEPNAISLDNKHWNFKFTLDIFYYKKRSFCLDIFLIYITFIILFKSIIGYKIDNKIFKKLSIGKK